MVWLAAEVVAQQRNLGVHGGYGAGEEQETGLADIDLVQQEATVQTQLGQKPGDLPPF